MTKSIKKPDLPEKVETPMKFPWDEIKDPEQRRLAALDMMEEYLNLGMIDDDDESLTRDDDEEPVAPFIRSG